AGVRGGVGAATGLAGATDTGGPGSGVEVAGGAGWLVHAAMARATRVPPAAAATRRAVRIVSSLSSECSWVTRGPAGRMTAGPVSYLSAALQLQHRDLAGRLLRVPVVARVHGDHFLPQPLAFLAARRARPHRTG